MRDHATAASSVSLNKVVALGIAPWGMVQNRQQLVNPQVVKAIIPCPLLELNTFPILCEQRAALYVFLKFLGMWFLLFLSLDAM